MTNTDWTMEGLQSVCRPPDWLLAHSVSAFAGVTICLQFSAPSAPSQSHHCTFFTSSLNEFSQSSMIKYKDCENLNCLAQRPTRM